MEPIPEEIERFLDANIETIDQLEVLRVLGDAPDREWAAAELARALEADPEALAGHLAALRSRGLVAAVARGAQTLWRHGATTPELAAMLGRLLELYRQRPVTLIKMVYAGANARLRAFAEAFRIRKEGG